MSEGFLLDRPVYTPGEVRALYAHYVRPISYPTVLNWIEVHRVTNGREGMRAHKTPRGRYLIEADEVERVLLEAGAKKG
jgi:hypothetical protein